jgi:hypothetical protein
MENTVRVKVSYNANEACRKQLILDGNNGTLYQELWITMPRCALNQLPIKINNDGEGYLKLEAHHYCISRNDIENYDHQVGGECECCGKYIDSTKLLKPIYNYEDVVQFLKDEADRKEKITQKLVQQNKEQELVAQIRLELTEKITKELEAKYLNSLNKLIQISNIIDKKIRVRTSQIKDIIQ